MVLSASSLRKFSKSGSKPLPQVEPGSRTRHSIPGPTSLTQFFSLLAFSILRKPLFVDPSVKAGIYLCAAAAGSLLFDFIKTPASYFSNKRNAINLLFVKWGWAWTFCSLATFILISTYIYSGGNRRLIRAHLMRLLVGSACWYIEFLFIYSHLVENLQTGHFIVGTSARECSTPWSRVSVVVTTSMGLFYARVHFDLSIVVPVDKQKAFGWALIFPVIASFWQCQTSGLLRSWRLCARGMS